MKNPRNDGFLSKFFYFFLEFKKSRKMIKNIKIINFFEKIAKNCNKIKNCKKHCKKFQKL